MPVSEQNLRAQFRRFHLSERDFKEADEYLISAQQRHSLVVRRALLTAATIAYSRPFTKNEQGDEVWATSKIALKLSKILTDTEHGLHEQLLNIRNKALAHSEFSLRPHDLRITSEHGYAVSGTHFDIVDECMDTNTFQVICRKLASASQSKKSELSRAIYHLRNAA